MLLHSIIIYITLFIIYSTFLYISPFLGFLSSQVFQRSNDNVDIEESKFSIPVKSKEKDNVEGYKNNIKSEDNVEGDKNKVNSVMMNEDDSNLVVKVSNLIEPPRDKDGKIIYELMSLRTGNYKTGDHTSTARRQNNSLHCNELCTCPMNECNFGGFANVVRR